MIGKIIGTFAAGVFFKILIKIVVGVVVITCIIKLIKKLLGNESNKNQVQTDAPNNNNGEDMMKWN